MSSTTTAYRKSSGCPPVLDRPAPGCFDNRQVRAGALSVGFDRDGPMLPASTRLASERPKMIAPAEPDAALQQLWFELPPADRTRFGGCFSRMVVKAWRGSQGDVTEDQT